jgi:hypothetical protein
MIDGSTSRGVLSPNCDREEADWFLRSTAPGSPHD